MSNENIWIAIIGAASGILTVLGVGKIIPAIIDWIKEVRADKDKRYQETSSKLEELTARLERVEKELSVEKGINQRMQSTLRSMLPLMRTMMNDVPAHVALLDQLEANIFGDLTPTDGVHRNNPLQ